MVYYDVSVCFKFYNRVNILVNKRICIYYKNLKDCVFYFCNKCRKLCVVFKFKESVCFFVEERKILFLVFFLIN